MGLCQQKQYASLDDNLKRKPAPRLDNYDFGQTKPLPLFDQFPKNKKEDNLDRFFQEQEKKKREEAKKFQDYFAAQEKKKKEEDKKFEYFTKLMAQKNKKQLKPSDTEMAKVLYAYMRHYGSIPGADVKQFIQLNYNSDYRSELYTIDSTTPVYTYKNGLIDRLTTANHNNWISDHQTFTKADQKNRTIWYSWTVRNQLTNERKIYDCVATFDEKNRFLTVVLRQVDNRYKPPLPAQVEKPRARVEDRSGDCYGGPATDWGAYYNAQTQRSNDQFRQRMNNQAREWNNYAQQKNARGW